MLETVTVAGSGMEFGLRRIACRVLRHGLEPFAIGNLRLHVLVSDRGIEEMAFNPFDVATHRHDVTSKGPRPQLHFLDEETSAARPSCARGNYQPNDIDSLSRFEQVRSVRVNPRVDAAEVVVHCHQNEVIISSQDFCQTTSHHLSSCRIAQFRGQIRNSRRIVDSRFAD